MASSQSRSTPDGNYIANAVSGKHIDHGTAVMKDGKACFTSAMTKDGEDVLDDPAGQDRALDEHDQRQGREADRDAVAKYVPMSMPEVIGLAASPISFPA